MAYIVPPPDCLPYFPRDEGVCTRSTFTAPSAEFATPVPLHLQTLASLPGNIHLPPLGNRVLLEIIPQLQKGQLTQLQLRDAQKYRSCSFFLTCSKEGGDQDQTHVKNAEFVMAKKCPRKGLQILPNIYKEGVRGGVKVFFNNVRKTAILVGACFPYFCYC